jgi:hypothetical protein
VEGSYLLQVQYVAEEYRESGFVGHSTQDSSRLVGELVERNKIGLRLLIEKSRGLGRFDL